MLGSSRRFAMLKRAAYISGFLAAIAVAVASVPGCGDGSDDAGGLTFDEVLAQVDGLSGAARTKKLVELAEAAGGELNLYTTSSIEVGYGDGGGVRTPTTWTSPSSRVVTPFRSGWSRRRRPASMAAAWSTGAPNLSFLSDEDVLTPYRAPSVSGLVAGSLHKDWTADRLNVFAVAWNTKRVPKGQEPQSWEDLADPRWKGKLGLQVDDYDWFKGLWEYWVASGKTPAEADRLAEAIARNAIFVDGRSFARELLCRGRVRRHRQPPPLDSERSRRRGARCLAAGCGADVLAPRRGSRRQRIPESGGRGSLHGLDTRRRAEGVRGARTPIRCARICSPRRRLSRSRSTSRRH